MQERLGDEVLDQAVANQGFDRRIIGKEIPRDQHDDRVFQVPSEGTDQGRAEDIRELGVDEDGPIAIATTQLDRLSPAERVVDRKSPARDEAPEDPVDRRFVVDGEEARGLLVTHGANGLRPRRGTAVPPRAGGRRSKFRFRPRFPRRSGPDAVE